MLSTPPPVERDAGRHAHPDRARVAQPVDMTAGPPRQVVLQAVHFGVKIGFGVHTHQELSAKIRSASLPAQIGQITELNA